MVQDTELTEEAKKGRKQLATTVVAGHGFKHLYNSAWSSILMPEVKIGMALTGTEFGVLAGASRVTSWVTTMVAGYLGDRFSHRAGAMLGISMAMLGVSYFLAGIAPNYWMLLLAVLLIGVGPSLYHPPAISALSRRFPDRRGFAISLHGTGGSGGEVAGPLVAAGLLTFLSWQGVLRISLMPALIGALVIWAMMRGLAGSAGDTSSFRAYIRSLVPLLRQREMQGLMAVTAMRSMGQGVIMTFLPVYLREDLGYSAARVALYLSMAQAMGIFAQPIMGYLSDRLGRKAVLVPAMGALGLLYAALTFADPGMQLILAILAMGTFHYSIHALLIAAAMDVAGGQVQSTVVSLIYGAGFLGTLSPVLAGAMADAYGTQSSFLLGGVGVLVATAYLATIRLPGAGQRLSTDP